MLRKDVVTCVIYFVADGCSFCGFTFQLRRPWTPLLQMSMRFWWSWARHLRRVRGRGLWVSFIMGHWVLSMLGTSLSRACTLWSMDIGDVPLLLPKSTWQRNGLGCACEKKFSPLASRSCHWAWHSVSDMWSDLDSDLDVWSFLAQSFQWQAKPSQGESFALNSEWCLAFARARVKCKQFGNWLQTFFDYITLQNYFH